MVCGVRYQLLTKAIQSPPTGDGSPSAVMQQRPGNVEMDEGRPWSGDLYDTGMVTDPQAAFAHFSLPGQDDVEAWIDQAEDGTVVGWVRDGEDVYRYTDPASWSQDVDDADMARIDTTSDGEMAAGMDAGPADPADPDAAPVDPEAAATVDPDGGPVEDETDTRSLGDVAPEAFADETDEATTEADPTEALKDPTHLPEGTDDGGADADDTFADLLRDDVDATQVAETDKDPNEPAVVADDRAEPAERDADDGETMTIAPKDLPKIDGQDPPAADAADEDLEGDDEDEGAAKRDKNWRFKKGMKTKHLPGQHNQEEHGNWAHHHGIGSHRHRSAASSAFDGDGGGSDPKGDGPSGPTSRPAADTAAGSPTPAPAAQPAKVSLNRESLQAMSDEDLAAVTEHDDFDMDTMFVAAEELDSRHDLDSIVRDAATGATPGSAEEFAVFASTIPADWLRYAAAATVTEPLSKRAEADDAWMTYWTNLAVRAEAATRGNLLVPRLRSDFIRRFGGTDSLFNGGVSRQQAKKYMSVELREYLDSIGYLSKLAFLAEFYPSYAKRLKSLGSRALSEQG